MTTKTKWVIDPNHSDIQFKVKHLMISTVSCVFKTYSGEIKSETDDFNNAEVSVEIDANSINTNHNERDSHVKSSLFLDTEKFPKINFTGIFKKNDNGLIILVDLNLCGVIKQISLVAEFTGTCQGLH